MRRLLALTLLFLSTSLYPQVEKEPDMELKFLTTGDVNQWDFEANYNLFKYMGLGLGIGIQSDFQHSYGGYLPKNIAWDVTDDDEKIYNLVVRPSFRLRTPYLRIAKNQMALYATPGLIIYPFCGDMVDIRFTKITPNKQYHYESWTESYSTPYFPIRLYRGVQLGIEYRLDEIAFIGGYEASNQDFYNSRRKLTFEGVIFNKKLPDKQILTQGIFIGLRYYP